jgi:O-antigen ligase
MFTVLGIHVKDQKQIKSFSIAFLILSLLNGINVIAEGYLTRQRVFGFAGIMYVDYVCVAILIAGIISFYFRNIKSIFFIAACLVLFAALLFTQTRNTLISLVLTLIFLLLFLFINSALFSINRKKLFFQLLIFLAGLALILIVLSLIVPEIFSRIMEIFVNKPHTSSNDSLVSNSLISRLLIWHTALNAFFRHPIIGIGAYSFYFDSQHYRTIPLFLYKDFVKNLSSHITYLSVLTETGIVGIIGFLIFLLSTLKMGYTSVKYSKSITNKYYSLGIFIVQIYIFFSMCFTDAWLWGQCGMLWSIILGLSVGNYKIIMRENTSFGKK